MRSASDRTVCASRGGRIREWLLGLALAAGAQGALATDLYVICSPGVTLQVSDVRNVFLGEKGFAGSVRLAPADNDVAQATFLERVLRLDASKYSALWTKKSFLNGVSPPPAEGTDAEAIAYVRKTAGACSYVTTPPGSGVTVVGKF
jgi:hypothetical protein